MELYSDRIIRVTLATADLYRREDVYKRQMVACRKVVRHRPMICLHHCTKPSISVSYTHLMSTGRNGVLTAFAANQRDEVRDLHDVAAALTAQPGMKQQTFVAGITAKGNGDCFLSEERHTALSLSLIHI